jgi:peptide subunit release factor 1 (eRF1)
MAETTPLSVQPLSQRMEVLAALEPSPFPFVSLYLSLKTNQNGREDHHQFVRKVLGERAKGFADDSPERQSFDKDAARIQQYLESEVDQAAQGLAIFASSGAEFFEALPLEAPFDHNELFIGSVPHLYPLARIIDTYPRYAAVMLDTNKARILVFGMAATERDEKIQNEKTRRTQKGGWSQARYQRRAENFHLHHIKEVVETLDKIVREDNINHIVVAAEEVALPIFNEQLPKHLAEKIVDNVTLQRNADGNNILETTLAALREKDAETDAEKVEQLMDAWQSGGLGVAGPEATLSAFQLGQVEELIITASPELLKPVQKLPDDAAPGDVQVDTTAPQGTGDEKQLKLADELVTRAHQTAARTRFIEDGNLLAGVGGVGALLRFRI